VLLSVEDQQNAENAVSVWCGEIGLG
jgi:hypothetical protein